MNDNDRKDLVNAIAALRLPSGCVSSASHGGWHSEITAAGAAVIVDHLAQMGVSGPDVGIAEKWKSAQDFAKLHAKLAAATKELEELKRDSASTIEATQTTINGYASAYFRVRTRAEIAELEIERLKKPRTLYALRVYRPLTYDCPDNGIVSFDDTCENIRISTSRDVLDAMAANLSRDNNKYVSTERTDELRAIYPDYSWGDGARYVVDDLSSLVIDPGPDALPEIKP